ncbi:MAG TPA: anti-sigma factor [Vicinamibacterales bacterium]|nr:anti-sigma factor [Vicinamibacterales bacterium]
MIDFDRHPTDLLNAALDGRLDAEDRAALNDHLAGCEPCRRELAALEWTRAQLTTAVDVADLPPDFTDRVKSTLDQVDAEGPALAPPAPGATGRRWWWAAAVAAAAAILVVAWAGPWFRPVPVPAAVAADLQAFGVSALPLELATSSPAELEAHLQAANLGFPVRVFDFGMMNLALTGGGVHRVDDERSALMAYRGADGTLVICQMYRGTTADLPETADVRRHNEMDFFVYQEGGASLIFWQEGDVVCVLAATGDVEAAVQLAYAKAIKV